MKLVIRNRGEGPTTAWIDGQLAEDVLSIRLDVTSGGIVATIEKMVDEVDVDVEVTG